MLSPAFQLENTTVEIIYLTIYIVSNNVFAYTYILFIYNMFASGLVYRLLVNCGK
jgi:hypothetical protein